MVPGWGLGETQNTSGCTPSNGLRKKKKFIFFQHEVPPKECGGLEFRNESERRVHFYPFLVLVRLPLTPFSIHPPPSPK